jgi:CHAT domain-containing protein
VSRAVRASLVMASVLIKRAQMSEMPQDQQSIFLQEATSLCVRSSSLAYRYNLQEQATWAVYEDMIALCIQRSQFERALGYLERARSMTLRRYLNNLGVARGKWNPQEDDIRGPATQARSASMLRIQQELKEWQERYRKYGTQLVNADPSASSAVDRELIQVELKRCEAKLSELFERLQLHESDTRLLFHPKRQIMRTENPVDIAQLRRHLSPNQLLLAYFLCQGKLVIFAVNTEGLIIHENPDGMAQLEYLLPLLFAHLELANRPNQKGPSLRPICHLLNKLYNLLITPMATLLPPSSGYLTIVPYGPLHNLPFHALFDGSHFLVEDFQINYLPSSNMLSKMDTCSVPLTRQRRLRLCLEGSAILNRMQPLPDCTI